MGLFIVEVRQRDGSAFIGLCRPLPIKRLRHLARGRLVRVTSVVRRGSKAFAGQGRRRRPPTSRPMRTIVPDLFLCLAREAA